MRNCVAVLTVLSLRTCFGATLSDLVVQVPEYPWCTALFTRQPELTAGNPQYDVVLTDSLPFVERFQPAPGSRQEAELVTEPIDEDDDYVEPPHSKSRGFNRLAVLSDGRLIGHVDDISEFRVPDDVESLLSHKTELVSFVYDASLPLNDNFRQILQQVEKFYGHSRHIYATNRTDSSHTQYARAFSKYRFSIIADQNFDVVSDVFLHAFAFHTLPAFNGFFRLSTMFANAVASYNEAAFHLPTFLGLLEDLTKQQKFVWSYQQMLQEVLVYRYSRPFEKRLIHAAREMCKFRGLIRQAKTDSASAVSPLAFLGIYSAAGNQAKRLAIRNTWLRVFSAHKIPYRFFMAKAAAADLSVAAENAQFGDMVFLDVEEGYRQNSRKGLRFLQWINEHYADQVAYLVKADDDIYLRPEAILEQIAHRTPVGYIWGFFDYISPVPRDATDHFFNSWDDYEFTVFPSYPRGVLRVMSMDVVKAIATLGHHGKLRMIFGDDPCTGVHIRQVVYHKDSDFPPTGIAQIHMDDFGSYTRFAMEPTCAKTWSSITPNSWVVHHIGADVIDCMWKADIAAGIYDGTWHARNPSEGFPNLCACVPVETSVAA